MPTKTFTELLQTARLIEGKGLAYTLEEGWMQGRAIYGGLSTALCLDGTHALLKDLPPLRSVSVNFIGPASPEVYVQASVLRRGKNVVFVKAELFGQDGLITHTVFCFGAAKASRLDAVYVPPKKVVGPESARSLFPEDGITPAGKRVPPPFTQYFEVALVNGDRPFSGSDDPSMELWVRHKDPSAKDMKALIALADMPPPAIFPVFKGFAPISSMSWMFNILTDDLTNQSGWWLMGVYGEHAKQGYSSQNMTIYNDKGELVVAGRQNIAVFY
ncbi:MAG: thioesterase family protein [Bacteroidota bacterium]